MRTMAPRPLLVALLLLASCATPGTEPTYPILIAPHTVDADGNRVPPTGRVKKGWIDHAKSPATDLVQLWLRESWYVGDWAYHPFFLAYDRESNRWEQWEIWAGDLFGYYSDERPAKLHSSTGEEVPVTFAHNQVGAVRQWAPMVYVSESDTEFMAAEFVGDDARRLLEVLRRPMLYPQHAEYLIWPGPNSNGYARWVLAEAGVSVDLDPKMVGKDWFGTFGVSAGLTPTRTGVHIDALSFGIAIGLLDGVELHFLGGTFGLDLWPPAIKTPFGRLGFAE